jgi:hypothetical protein
VLNIIMLGCVLCGDVGVLCVCVDNLWWAGCFEFPVCGRTDGFMLTCFGGPCM